ncbi:UPF0587 protein C1orf123 homolog [Chenopodium quinoa]|uniref:UPF0587 protein C1orf123 homolog n=1 Tax=Chenopodium quinoa TaxID=63459 RepID=UPI000B76E87C|nr:UPF0587 protein C1orf123 homolog [Chenopodium quinoa]
MVTFNLMITAEVENVSNILPMGGLDDPNFLYYFKVKCGNCGEVTEKESYVMLGELVPIPKSRGQANLVQKCKFCGREGTITMIPKSGRYLTGDDCEAGKFVRLMSFDCRGLEPVDYSFGGDQWKIITTAGTVFENVDLSDGDWADYDEKKKMPTSVGNLQARFEVMKT